MSTAQAKLTEAKTALLLHVPFFASLLLDMMRIHLGKFPHVFPPGNETMAVDGKNIYIDEDFIMELRLSECVFALCHEVGHAMWDHMGRAKHYMDVGLFGAPFNPMLWNIAGDYIINDMLKEAKIGKLIKGVLWDPAVATQHDITEEVYKKLQQKQQQQQGKGGKGGNGGQPSRNPKHNQGPDGVPDGTFDTHMIPDAGSQQDQESRMEWKRAIASAADAAKAVGNMPAGLERFVTELLNPKVPWNEHLRSVFVKAIGRERKDWSRIHRRRYVSQGIVLPAYKGYGCGQVVFCVDTSGSMSDDEIKQALGECDAILTDCNPEEVILIGCDAAVESVTYLGPSDSLRDNSPACRLGGGGGTSFIPPFKWCADNGVRPDALVYFTDMGGQFPREDPGFPVIWCATTECRPDHDIPGKIIPCELEV